MPAAKGGVSRREQYEMKSGRLFRFHIRLPTGSPRHTALLDFPCYLRSFALIFAVLAQLRQLSYTPHAVQRSWNEENVPGKTPGSSR